MSKLNNKGYMLVEIILASALAFGLAYFILDLTIKLKNKNDDLLVRTLTATDQAIITNIIMKELYETSGTTFTCDQISISGNTFTYGTHTNIVNEYANLGSLTCNTDSDTITIKIPLSVKQLSEENFDIDIIYKK